MAVTQKTMSVKVSLDDYFKYHKVAQSLGFNMNEYLLYLLTQENRSDYLDDLEGMHDDLVVAYEAMEAKIAVLEKKIKEKDSTINDLNLKITDIKELAKALETSEDRVFRYRESIKEFLSRTTDKFPSVNQLREYQNLIDTVLTFK